MRALRQIQLFKNFRKVHTVAKDIGPSKMPLIPMAEPFPGFENTILETRTIPEQTHITTLPSGLRVVSRSGSKEMANLAVLIDTGSRYEDDSNQGINHFLESLTLKAGAPEVAHEARRQGVEVFSEALRENTTLAAECLTPQFPCALEMLGSIVSNPTFSSDDIEEAKHMYSLLVCDEKEANPDLVEFTHQAAFNNNTLGRSLIANRHHLEGFTSEVLKAHTQKYWTADRMVVGAVGIEHEELVERVSEHFAGVPLPSIDTPRVASQYTGGKSWTQTPAEDGLLQISLGFQAPSWHSDDLLPLFVLTHLMGGGGAFSAGGPGKGMYSRLYLNVLNHHWAIHTAADAMVYNDCGIFTISGTVEPEYGRHFLQVIVNQILLMKGPISDVELSRAQNQLKSQLMLNLESSQLFSKELTMQVHTYDRCPEASEWVEKIDAVTAADVQRVAANMIAAPLSTALIGDNQTVPIEFHDVLESVFKK